MTSKPHQPSYEMRGDLWVDCLLCHEPVRYGFATFAQVVTGWQEVEVDKSHPVISEGKLYYIPDSYKARILTHQTGRICTSCASSPIPCPLCEGGAWKDRRGTLRPCNKCDGTGKHWPILKDSLQVSNHPTERTPRVDKGMPSHMRKARRTFSWRAKR